MSDATREGDETAVSEAHSEVSKPADGLVGRTIDQRYRVDSLLGEGGMGLVYRVTHTRLNKSLAIKVLRRENTRDPEVLARFRREAESASAIGNQHIIDINDFGVLEDGSTYFVMECLEGVDLIDAIEVAERMPEERAIQIAAQVCRALGAAHDAGIIHRDLKPENVFLIRRNDTEDFVKVLDFGIAKVANGPKRLTRDGEVLGTPHYMSPEQCEGENVDHRTDIYALGVLLYEMVTGHVPHDADTMMGILTKQMYEDPIPPKIRVPQVSSELEELIMRCLEKKPELRYQTMQDIEGDLRRVSSGQQGIGPNTVTLTPTRPHRSGPSRVSPVYLGGLGLAVIALIGALSVSSATKRREQAEMGHPARGLEPAKTALASESSSTRTEAQSNAEQTIRSESDAPKVATRREAASRSRARPRQASKPTPRRDESILDPWK